MTWLGVLNFVVLQWFGVRLMRRFETHLVDCKTRCIAVRPDGSMSVGYSSRSELVFVGWGVLRWVWPLTGWWSPYRWIRRVP